MLWFGETTFVVPAETPQSLFDFFSSLAAGGAETEEKCELHYGCKCVIHRALAASQMLMKVQKTLGVTGTLPAGDTGAAPAADPIDDAEANADAEARESKIAELMTRQRQAVEEAEQESDRLLVQNMELAKDNEKLHEKLIILHKQIDRMYAKSEMSTLLDKLESGESEPKPAKAETATPEAEAEPEPKPEPTPEPEPEVEPTSSEEASSQNEVEDDSSDESDEITSLPESDPSADLSAVASAEAKAESPEEAKAESSEEASTEAEAEA